MPTVSGFLERHLRDVAQYDDHWLAISELADAFRQADEQTRRKMIESAPRAIPPWDALFAAIVEDLCDEQGVAYPPWTTRLVSAQPFLAWPVSSPEGEAALRRATKQTYARHNVFVPGNLLSRA
jgi:hypothetical protein